jgi:hypothetical protein
MLTHSRELKLRILGRYSKFMRVPRGAKMKRVYLSKFKPFAALVLVTLATILLFQNCEKFAAIGAAKSTLSAASLASRLHNSIVFNGPHVICSDLSGTTPAEVARLLQACFDSAVDNGTVELAPGIHQISQVVTINKSVHVVTQGLSESSAPCGANSAGQCALIRAISPVAGITRGFFVIHADRVELDHIVIDGNKSQRSSSPEAAACRAGSNGSGMNIEATTNSSLSLVGITSMNALCGTGAEIAGATLMVSNSSFLSNGTHNVESMWSDGMTVLSSSGASVSGNTFQDNTDVNLIFGSCPNCDISKNSISHSGSFSGSSYAALMLGAFPNQLGDFSGTTISGNSINCANYRCGFGLMIGSLPWYTATSQGGLYINNQVQGAQLGILINTATNPSVPVQIGPNAVTNCGGQFLSGAGSRSAPALGISSTSISAVQFVQGASSSQMTTVDFTNAIMNWWTQDSVTTSLSGAASVCSPTTQMAPDWGAKNGQCLRSCGALGGTQALADACSNHGLTDVGAAYDAPYCCKVPSAMTATPMPTATPQSMQYASTILNNYTMYLPGCYTADRAASWESFFMRGGTLSDFVSTLQTVATTVPPPDCMTNEAKITNSTQLLGSVVRPRRHGDRFYRDTSKRARYGWCGKLSALSEHELI